MVEEAIRTGHTLPAEVLGPAYAALFEDALHSSLPARHGETLPRSYYTQPRVSRAACTFEELDTEVIRKSLYGLLSACRANTALLEALQENLPPGATAAALAGRSDAQASRVPASCLVSVAQLGKWSRAPYGYFTGAAPELMQRQLIFQRRLTICSSRRRNPLLRLTRAGYTGGRIVKDTVVSNNRPPTGVHIVFVSAHSYTKTAGRFPPSTPFLGRPR